MTEAEKQARRLRKRADDVVGSQGGSLESWLEHDEEVEVSSSVDQEDDGPTMDAEGTLSQQNRAQEGDEEEDIFAESMSEYLLPDAHAPLARASPPSPTTDAHASAAGAGAAGDDSAVGAADPAAAPGAPPTATAPRTSATSGTTTNSKEMWCEDIFADMFCNDEFVDDQFLMDEEELEEEEEEERQEEVAAGERDQAESNQYSIDNPMKALLVAV